MGVTNKEYGRTVGQTEILVVPISFETGENTSATAILFPFRAKVTYLESIVTKATATDDATITPSNSVGNMANGTITIAAPGSVGDVDTATPTTNQIVAANTDLTLTPAKTTANGKCVVTVHYVRS